MVGGLLAEGLGWCSLAVVRTATFVSCQVVTIDSIVEPGRRVVLIHLDVEGSEARALRGSLRTIRQWLPDLLLET